MADQAGQRKLLTEKDLTFQWALDIVQSDESTRKNVTASHGSQAAVVVHEIHQVKAFPSSCYTCWRKGHHQTQCKFKTATCHHCGKIGHIKPVCHSLSSSRQFFVHLAFYRLLVCLVQINPTWIVRIQLKHQIVLVHQKLLILKLLLIYSIGIRVRIICSSCC